MFVIVTMAAVAAFIVKSYSSRSLYNQISSGMTHEQVAALMGSEGEQVGSFDWADVEHNETREIIMRTFPHQRREWVIGSHKILVLFGRDGRVATKYYQRRNGAGTITTYIDDLGL
jgi:hypothetical protein